MLIPTGLLLLTATAAAPLLRWGKPPAGVQRRMLLAGRAGRRAGRRRGRVLRRAEPIHLAVVALATFAAAALIGALLLDARRRESARARFAVLAALVQRRRQYAGYLIHLGLACLAVGVAGSSLGSRQHEVSLGQGETVAWAGRTIRLPAHDPAGNARQAHRRGRDRGHRRTRRRRSPCGLPSYRYKSQDEWTTEVAIHSTWGGDFYAIYRGEQDEAKVSLTLIDNPMMRWIWTGGWLFALGSLVRLWPSRRRPAVQAVVPAPHWMPDSSSRDLAA